MKTILASFVVIGLAGFGAAYYVAQNMAVEPPSSLGDTKVQQPVHAAKVECDSPPCTITTTGTVKPEELVEVGAQVNGMIEAFGPDPANPSKPIDHGSVVHKGAVLAKIDPAIYMAQVDFAEASLSRVKADLLQLQAKCSQTKQEWLRAQSLLPSKAIADTDYDIAVANYQVATANVAVGQAAIQQSEATLRVAKTYLNYTVIKSPIDGVIIDRRVNIGQTVIASFNAPGLFLIAKDLRRVQVWASIDETDIGCIHPGLPVRFTVGAYPSETFEGKVAQIRLNPTKTQDRTAYTVVVATNNAHGMLPYLTAKLRFEVERQANVRPISNGSPQKTQSLGKDESGPLASR